MECPGSARPTLANKLPKTNWFHYSGDYRIGTRYLAEPIVDNVKRAAMQVPFLRSLLCSDSIYIASNITVHNLEPLSTFLGKVGDPSKGGLACEEFLARQRLHHEAEVHAMRDVVEFLEKARDIYGYDHFVNDAGGSICELGDPETIEVLASHTMIVYIRADMDMEQELIRRQKTHPKPLYYDEMFFRRSLAVYLEEEGLGFVRYRRSRPFRALDVSPSRRAAPATLREDRPRPRVHGDGGPSRGGTRRAGFHRSRRLRHRHRDQRHRLNPPMPLVAHSSLPSFERLRSAGQEVLTLDRAQRQDIRELHIGLLNMMPDAALRATERQFMRLAGSCNRIVQIHVHPFAVDAGTRGPEAREYIDRYYESFDDLSEAGLDALIISGANPAQPEMEDEPFWEPLVEVMEWASENVCSVVCSCLATHAYLRHFHGIARRRCLPDKRWGVYEHRNLGSHPLIANLNTRFDAPHSHVYEVTSADVASAGAQVLSESEEAGIYLAVSADGFRFVFFQGHPEYDKVSLAKEFKREVTRFAAGERGTYPGYPERYFGRSAREMLDRHREEVMDAMARGAAAPAFPDAELAPRLDNTWTDTGKAMFNNWLGLVYQLTDADRRKPLMASLDPDDPLGLETA